MRKADRHRIIRESCGEVVGSTRFIEDALSENGIDPDTLTPEEHGIIDEHIFVCDACGWTCDIDEMGPNEEETICAECQSEREG